ncbi:MAG TPA: hypothetical protein VGL22_10760 [Terracidiphilus sp.]|jgi:hypothetical protein
MGPARLSLYLIGIAAGIAAIVTYRKRSAGLSTTSPGRVPVQKAADMLREAWADHHTTA